MPSSSFEEKTRQYYLVLQYDNEIGFVPILLTYDRTVKNLACALLPRTTWVPMYLDDTNNIWDHKDFLGNQVESFNNEKACEKS